MRRFRLVFLLLTLIMSVGCMAQDSLVECHYVVGKHYFAEVPMGVELDTVTMVYNFETKKFIRLYSEKHLTEDDLRYEVPEERVANLEDIKELLKSGKRAPSQKSYIISPEALKVGDPIGKFKVQDVEGNVYSDSSTLGRPLVLNFWFTGCGPCIKEMPIISTWMDSVPEATYLAVTFNTAKEIAGIVERRGFRFHQVTEDAQLIGKFKVQSFPLTVVIDKKGAIRLLMYGTTTQKRDNILRTIKMVNAE